MALSASTQAAIDKALASRDAAGGADQADAAAVQQLQAATDAEAAAKTASIAAHKTALDDAHAAIDALTSELTGTPPAPPSG